MTTIDSLRQQLENQYLEPLIEETPSTPLLEDIDDTQTTFKLTSGVLSPDEENHIGPGSVLELGYELTRVVSYNYSTKEVTECRRGVRGSDKTAHVAADTDVRLPTRWPRSTQAKTLATAVDVLWRPLFAVKEVLATVETAQYLPLPLATVRLVNVEFQHPTSLKWDPVAAELFPTHPTNTTRAAVQIGVLPYRSALCRVKYGVKMERPDDNMTEITDFPTRWERIVLADAAAELLAGVDIDAVTQEVLTEQMRLDRFAVKSGSSISQSLVRYREYLVEKERAAILAVHPKQVRRRPVSVWS